MPTIHVRRHAAVLLIALVAIAVAGALVAVLVRNMLRDHQAIQWEHRVHQATWLAESALDRAAASLAVDADYAGETLTLEAETLPGRFGAVVTIRVVAVDEASGRRSVEVRVDHPEEAKHRARVRKTVEISP